MATAKKASVKLPPAPKEPEQLPFSRLKYNVDRKRDLIREHQADLVEMERELQLRCPHFDVEKYVEKVTSTDFYAKEQLVTMVRCKDCGLTRPFRQ